MEDALLHEILSQNYPSYHCIPLSGGNSKALVFKLVLPEKNLVIKQTPLALRPELIQEIELLLWLDGKIKVSQYQWHKFGADTDWLCTTWIAGNTLDSIDMSWPITERVAVYADTLKLIHSIPLTTKTPKRLLPDVLAEAERRVTAGLVDTTEFEDVYQGYSAEQLLQQIFNSVPPENDLVFTHGDFCPANVLFHNKKLSGIIDWSRGGIADRYQDLALAIRSIRHEWGEVYVRTFLSIYGLTEIDHQKLEFYTLLDECF